MSYVGIGNRQDYIADFPTQSFNGDGSTTTFTLNFEAVTGSVRVAVDNVLQPADGSSYYVNGNSLTFTSAPASGTNNISVVYLGTVRNISSVSDNAITAAKLNSAAITGQTAETSVADDDLVLIYDDSATALRKMTKSNFTSGLATTNGITEADQWRLTANKTSTGVITANLERVDTDGGGYIGTGMTESSGVFTFPSTGIWLITYNQLSDGLVRVNIETTVDNSSYTSASYVYCDSSVQSGEAKFLFDVTSTSTHKVKFDYWNGSGTLYGSTNANFTHFTFIRLGDT